MHYPATWDPFFASYMTLADLYRYPTRHFRFHQRQLALGRAPAAGTAGPAAAAAGTGRSTGRRPGAGLAPHQARRFYDRLGRGQDLQAFYEDQPAAELIAAASFPAARSVFELGCGTGRLAENLLARHLPAGARYLGADISDTMVTLSQARLRRFGGRAHVLRADATVPLPAADGGFDRFLAVYVLDLLAPGDATAVIAQARRLLRPGGLLCAVSLAPGQAPAARLVSQAWTGIWSRAPGLVGGCRPIRLEPLLDGWHITHRALVTAWALASEVIIATPREPADPPETPHPGHPQDPQTEDRRPRAIPGNSRLRSHPVPGNRLLGTADDRHRQALAQNDPICTSSQISSNPIKDAPNGGSGASRVAFRSAVRLGRLGWRAASIRPAARTSRPSPAGPR